MLLRGVGDRRHPGAQPGHRRRASRRPRATRAGARASTSSSPPAAPPISTTLNLDAARIRRAKIRSGSAGAERRRCAPPIPGSMPSARPPATPGAASSALEADLVVRAALLGQPSRYDPPRVPRLTLTDPPNRRNRPHRADGARAASRPAITVLRASYAENDRARAGRDGMGVVKLVVGARRAASSAPASSGRGRRNLRPCSRSPSSRISTARAAGRTGRALSQPMPTLPARWARRPPPVAARGRRLNPPSRLQPLVALGHFRLEAGEDDQRAPRHARAVFRAFGQTHRHDHAGDPCGRSGDLSALGRQFPRSLAQRPAAHRHRRGARARCRARRHEPAQRC